MELRHLRYFIAAAEEEHFGRASHRLHVTRPAVSQLIADLENELGTPLFERVKHRVRLTAAGRSLLVQLEPVMAGLDGALATAKRIGQGKSGTLTVAYGSLTLLHPLFRAAIKKFHEAYPDVTLTLVEMRTSDQAKELARGGIDGGFMHFGPEPAPRRRGDVAPAVDDTVLDWFRIQTGTLGAVVPNDHWLARRKSVTLKDLAGERFVVVPRATASPSYGLLYALCQKAGFEPDIIQEVSSTASQLNLVSVGMGICLAVIGKNFSYPSSVAVVPLRGISYTTSFVFGWARGQHNPVLARMIEIVTSLAKNGS